MSKTSKVAVLGAAGHIGQAVVTELLNRGITPVAIARNIESLERVGFDQHVILRTADIGNESLKIAFNDVQVVVNCAGPFIDTSHMVVAAALDAGIHYVDISAEQLGTEPIFEKFHEPAVVAGLAVVQGMGLIGGLPDLMATELMKGWEEADSIDIYMQVDGWNSTQGILNTFARKAIGDTIFVDGRLTLMKEPLQKQWIFPNSEIEETVCAVPFSETILMPTHLNIRQIRNHITKTSLDSAVELSWGRRPEKAIDPSQKFSVEVIVQKAGQMRRLYAVGPNGCSFSAPFAVEAAVRLLNGEFQTTGVRAPGDIFDSKAFLASLMPANCTFHERTTFQNQKILSTSTK
jgi:hypothetical protein